MITLGATWVVFMRVPLYSFAEDDVSEQLKRFHSYMLLWIYLGPVQICIDLYIYPHKHCRPTAIYRVYGDECIVLVCDKWDSSLPNSLTECHLYESSAGTSKLLHILIMNRKMTKCTWHSPFIWFSTYDLANEFWHVCNLSHNPHGAAEFRLWMAWACPCIWRSESKQWHLQQCSFNALNLWHRKEHFTHHPYAAV